MTRKNKRKRIKQTNKIAPIYYNLEYFFEKKIFTNKMYLLILALILLIIFYYLYSIQIIRYCELKSTSNIKFYDKRYSKLPRVHSKRKVIISLTTIPSRINNLKPTLASLLNSTQRVDNIYLNIPYYSCKGEKYKIPKWLERCRNIKINRAEKDYGPGTKLIPVLKKEKKTIIIVVDDDVIYGSKMVENYISTFYKRREKDALTIFGSYIHKGRIDSEYPSFLQYRGPGYVGILKGHDSFLVTPEMFPKEVFNFKKGPKECFWVDDVWFSGWLKYNGVRIYSLGFSNQNIPITNIDLLEKGDGLCSTKNLTDKNNTKALKFFSKKMKVKF